MAEAADNGRFGPGGFDALYGLKLLEAGPERVLAEVPVSERLLQPFGLVHGGVHAAIAESICLTGTTLGVRERGGVAVALSNGTSFLRPISGGVIHAAATRRHAGSTTWVWEVELTDDEGRLCVLTRLTLAVRPLAEGAVAAGSA
jgi:1,4-dihydroxy-2-naphthoyl-CoA hydrolase